MASFNASLRTIADRRGLPAKVTIGQQRISIRVGDHEIGDWPLDEVRLEATGDSVYRMEAEGDQILIDLDDFFGFRDVLEASTPPGARPRGRPHRKSRRPGRAPATDEAVVSKRRERRGGVATRADKKREKPTQSKPERAHPVKDAEEKPRGVLARLDGALEAGEKRWGAALPRWLFTRAAVGVAVLLAGVTFIFPGLASTLLLIAGLAMVLLGAVVYTDTLLAIRWLPGRLTPMHVLIGGVGTVMLGVLLGVVA